MRGEVWRKALPLWLDIPLSMPAWPTGARRLSSEPPRAGLEWL